MADGGLGGEWGCWVGCVGWVGGCVGWVGLGGREGGLDEGRGTWQVLCDCHRCKSEPFLSDILSVPCSLMQEIGKLSFRGWQPYFHFLVKLRISQ